jgi:hypothetical protein
MSAARRAKTPRHLPYPVFRGRNRIAPDKPGLIQQFEHLSLGINSDFEQFDFELYKV